MLQELLKVTPEDHIDYPNVQKALELARSVAENVNSSKRDSNHFKELQKINSQIEFGKSSEDEDFFTVIQKDRKYITELDCKVDGIDRMIYIFSDILVCLGYNILLFYFIILLFYFNFLIFLNFFFPTFLKKDIQQVFSIRVALQKKL